MKKFKNLEEYQEYNRKKSLKQYHKTMADPEKAEAYRAKRREYDKRRYREIMKELREVKD